MNNTSESDICEPHGLCKICNAEENEYNGISCDYCNTYICEICKIEADECQTEIEKTNPRENNNYWVTKYYVDTISPTYCIECWNGGWNE